MYVLCYFVQIKCTYSFNSNNCNFTSRERNSSAFLFYHSISLSLISPLFYPLSFSFSISFFLFYFSFPYTTFLFPILLLFFQFFFSLSLSPSLPIFHSFKSLSIFLDTPVSLLFTHFCATQYTRR